MEDKKISRETAVLAKEKGFKELTSHYYLDREILMEKGFIVEYPLEQDYEIDFEDLFDYFNNNYKRDIKGNSCLGCNNKKYQESFSAPTQALLQKWLREVHNIRLIESIPVPKALEDKLPNRVNKISFCLYNREWNPTMIECSREDTYESALEIGLQEALKLIKNEKVNNDE